MTIVLIVEDEAIQRMALVDMVEEAGFEALEASNADIAVVILESRTDIRLVFTDIDMPGSLDGIKLAAAIRDRWPPIEIILTTAGAPPDLESLLPRSFFLPKPIRRKDAISLLMRLAA